MAPISAASRDPFDFNALRFRDNNSSGYGSLNQFKDNDFTQSISVRGFKDNDFTQSMSVRGVSHSVTSRARNGFPPAGSGHPAAPCQKFMSLEEECNWILSGREPLGHDDDIDEEDDEDNTLDDISGDEVQLDTSRNRKYFLNPRLCTL